MRTGGYEVQEKSTGEKQFYRFQKPANADYPFMLELFSRQPDVLQVAEGSHLTPLPVEEDASSLSAILLDNDYYNFIRAGRQEIDGLPWVGAAQLVALKARATTIFERYRRWPVCRSSQERVRSAPSTFGAPDIGSHS